MKQPDWVPGVRLLGWTASLAWVFVIGVTVVQAYASETEETGLKSSAAAAVSPEIEAKIKSVTQGAAIVVGKAPSPGNLEGVLVRSRYREGVVRPAYVDPETGAVFIAGHLVTGDGGDYTRSARRALVAGRVIPDEPEAQFQWPKPRGDDARARAGQRESAPASEAASADQQRESKWRRALKQAIEQRNAARKQAADIQARLDDQARSGDAGEDGADDRKAERESDSAEQAESGPTEQPNERFTRTDNQDPSEASQSELRKALEVTRDKAQGISLTEAGNGSRTLYVFADPRCPYCEKLRNKLVDNESYLREQGIGVEWIPIGILGEQSVRDAVRVAAAGVSAVRNGVVSAGPMPEGEALEQAKKMVVNNVEVMKAAAAPSGCRRPPCCGATASRCTARPVCPLMRRSPSCWPRSKVARQPSDGRYGAPRCGLPGCVGTHSGAGAGRQRRRICGSRYQSLQLLRKQPSEHFEAMVRLESPGDEPGADGQGRASVGQSPWRTKAPHC